MNLACYPIWELTVDDKILDIELDNGISWQEKWPKLELPKLAKFLMSHIRPDFGVVGGRAWPDMTFSWWFWLILCDLGGVRVVGEVPQDVAVDHQGAADHLNAAVDVHRWPPSLLSGNWWVKEKYYNFFLASKIIADLLSQIILTLDSTFVFVAIFRFDPDSRSDYFTSRTCAGAAVPYPGLKS